MRAPQTEWRKGSVIAVDAGAHLASIVRILEQDMPTTSRVRAPQDHSELLENGPFAGVRFPHLSAKANGLWFFRELMHSFLITHPHLDHLAALGINTPALEYGREAKAIVALPSTIDAIKSHIFNDAIWPNLSDEDHGVGFVTYRRLIEGGNPRLGYGEARGYVNVCDGLATKCWSVSHGKCTKRASISHQRGESFGFGQPDFSFPSRRLSRISDDHGYFAAMAAQQQGREPGGLPPFMPSQMAAPSNAVTPGLPSSVAIDRDHIHEAVSSSAFFIRNDVTGNELLIFGDIEPDSVSISPRNHIVWNDAAPKIVQGSLKAMFIECSYDDSVRDDDLYGHLCPRHLIGELTFLANAVLNLRERHSSMEPTQQSAENGPNGLIATPSMQMTAPPTAAEMKKKRKRGVNGNMPTTPELGPVDPSGTVPLASSPAQSPYAGTRSASHTRRKASHSNLLSDGDGGLRRPSTPSRGPRHVQFTATGQATPSGAVTAHGVSQTATKEKLAEPLKGLTIHIIHVKDTLMDGPTPQEIIESQLQKLAKEVGLGCEFHVTRCGMDIWV